MERGEFLTHNIEVTEGLRQDISYLLNPVKDLLDFRARELYFFIVVEIIAIKPFSTIRQADMN